MADEQDALRRTRLTPLLSERLQVSTPPLSASTRQNAAQKSENPSKKTLSRPRREAGEDRTPRSYLTRCRTLFDEENDDITEISRYQPAQVELGESSEIQESDSAGPYCENRKRTAARVQELSHLGLDQSEKKKSKMNRMQDAGRRQVVLERAVSSQTVSISENLSPSPTIPPKLLRYHASEQSINVKSAASVSLKPILPTVHSSRHPDLNVITPETVARILSGEFDDKLAGFALLDCRFAFEFQGGSLKGASSLCDPDKMETQLFVATELTHSTRTALIFFCEFSANRAPKMLRHVRNVDRRLHADSYPELYYPELYLIDGGYKHCFETLQMDICAPAALYVRMEDEDFVDECRLEFAAWRRRWKPHKTVANCAAKLEKGTKHLTGEASSGHVRPDISHGVRSLFDEL